MKDDDFKEYEDFLKNYEDELKNYEDEKKKEKTEVFDVRKKLNEESEKYLKVKKQESESGIDIEKGVNIFWILFDVLKTFVLMFTLKKNPIEHAYSIGGDRRRFVIYVFVAAMFSLIVFIFSIDKTTIIPYLALILIIAPFILYFVVIILTRLVDTFVFIFSGKNLDNSVQNLLSYLSIFSVPLMLLFWLSGIVILNPMIITIFMFVLLIYLFFIFVRSINLMTNLSSGGSVLIGLIVVIFFSLFFYMLNFIAGWVMGVL